MNSQINEYISISSVIIIYELIILSLYYTRFLSRTNSSKLISFLVPINFFIIFVMFLTDCKVDYNALLWIIILKIFLLCAMLSIAKFTYLNYFISFLILAIYYIFSNINKIYDCKIKMMDLLNCFILSSFIYISLVLLNN